MVFSYRSITGVLKPL